MKFYTTEQLGPKQELTPEGFLLCRDVAIARTGQMLYVGGEVPVEAGADGLIRIDRSPDEVFREETIDSFQGKAVTLDHPGEDVDPKNWSRLAKGVTQNVRRGSGIEDNLLFADLLITDHEAIQQIRDGLREVSCGYDANYSQTDKGYGFQSGIVGNHVALVEKGRCGSRCAIGDSMKKKLKDRVMAAFKARDEAALETALEESAKDEAPEDPIKKLSEDMARFSDGFTKFDDSLKTIDSRLSALETADKKARDEAAEKEEEEKKKASDAEAEAKKKKDDDEDTEDGLTAETQDVFARAEILSPGLALPTVDAKGDKAKVRDSLCALRRKALAKAYDTDKGREAIAPFVAGAKNPDFTKLTCDALSSVFIGASEVLKRENNSRSLTLKDASKIAHEVANNISAINRRNAEFWARK